MYCNELCLLYEYFKSGGEEEKNKGQTRTARLIRILLGPCGWSGDRWVLGAGPALPRARAGAGAGPGVRRGRGRSRGRRLAEAAEATLPGLSPSHYPPPLG